MNPGAFYGIRGRETPSSSKQAGFDENSACAFCKSRNEYGDMMDGLLSEEQKKIFMSLKGDLIKWKDDGST